jgi:cytoskeletal protein CcmA (bactofilin family)
MKIVGGHREHRLVKIEGIVEGAVRGARHSCSADGHRTGDIRAHEVVIGGTVIGTIVADERVEIQGTSSVQGDNPTKSIVVLEGASSTGPCAWASRLPGMRREDVRCRCRNPDETRTRPSQ